MRKGTSDNAVPARKTYRRFLLSVMLCYVTDILWGVLDTFHLIALLYADTVVYYIEMALSVMTWTQYVVSYLKERSKFSKRLYAAGQNKKYRR